MGIEITSEWFGDRLPELKTIGRAATRIAGEYLKGQAIPRTPVDLGNLRGSYQVRGQNAEPTTLVVVNAEYGFWVHERLELRHDEGEAKFLENALNDNRAAMLALIATEVRRAIAAAG